MRSSRLIALIACCILLYLVVLYNVSNKTEVETETRTMRESRLTKEVVKADPPTPPPRNIVIYSATKFFNMDVTTERFLSECHSSKGWCRLSENPADIAVADAVLFHNADYAESKVPRPRSPKPHVLWSLESPANDRFRPGPHVINWTMTPRRDADIWYPYGHFVKLDTPISHDMDSIWSLKRHDLDATWLASNCYTRNRRKELIDSIVKHGVTADLFGSCGRPAPLNCSGVDKQGYDCVIDLVKPYKFYFSIENSNCRDYVTEKFYETLRSRMAVPIVLDRQRYEDVGAPSSSFIAVDDFSSIAELAAHLKRVSKDKKEYLAYHQWRNTHQVLPEHDDSTGFCELCRRLQYNRDVPSKSYADISEWNDKGICEQGKADRYL